MQAQKYLLFDSGRFYLDEAVLKSAQNAFKIYAVTDQQIRTVKHYRELVDILNFHLVSGLTGPATIQKVADLLNLRFVENKVYLNEENLIGLIK